MARDKLTAAKIQSFLKPTWTGAAKVADGLGLYITKTPAGTGVWRFAYRWQRQQRTLCIGTTNDIGLAEARTRRDDARRLLRDNIDPAAHKREKRAAAVVTTSETFARVAALWLEKNRRVWSPSYYRQTERWFRNDVLPGIGKLHMRAITPPMISHLVDRMLKRDVPTTAKKVRMHVASVFEFARGKGWCDHDPVSHASLLIRQHPSEPTQPHPAILDIEELRTMLGKTDDVAPSECVRLCAKLIAFTASRLKPARLAEWSEFDLDGAVPTWTIPRSKMKSKRTKSSKTQTSPATAPFTIYLGPAIVDELKRWRSLARHPRFLFPNERSKTGVITSGQVASLYNDVLGLRDRHCAHGWRSSFSSAAHEARIADPAIIEMSLDHAVGDQISRIYNRSQQAAERIRLAVWWDSTLAPPEPDVISISARRA